MVDLQYEGQRVAKGTLEERVKPSEEILKYISNFPEPTSLKEVRIRFGHIEQVACSYSIGDTMTNFRNLVKPTVKTWVWTPTLRNEFRKAKRRLIIGSKRV